MPHSPSKQAPWDPTSYFPESHQHYEISSLSKVILVWGKAKVTGHKIWAVAGLSHMGDLMFHQKTAQEVMHEQACGCDKIASHQLPQLWPSESS